MIWVPSQSRESPNLVSSSRLLTQTLHPVAEKSPSPNFGEIGEILPTSQRRLFKRNMTARLLRGQPKYLREISLLTSTRKNTHEMRVSFIMVGSLRGGTPLVRQLNLQESPR